MKLHKLLILAALPLISLTAGAQKAPQKGDFTVALTMGYNNSTMYTAKPSNSNSYSVSAQSTNWNDKGLAVGIEGGWFFQDLWKVSLGGGMNITKKPGYAGIEGTTSGQYGGFELGDIPTYNTVADESYFQFTVIAGVDRYLKTNVEGLMPYGGARLGYAYGRNVAFWDDANYMGKSVGESFNIKGALIVGVDYFLTDAIFVGAQVYPFAYTYNRSLIKPQEGLENWAASSHNFGFLAEPTLKVGFKF